MPKIINLKNVLIFASIAIVAMSVIVRIIVYIKCRSLWLDEAMLAESIVPRNWLELLATPLASGQSAPVLYVIAVKAIGSIFGYSEGSLRIFSFFAFIGLLILEVIFLKNVFNFSNCKICFVAVMTALLPNYFWYSNELKPYMGDAFFVLLITLLYSYYTQGKIKLPILTVSYIYILGYSSPAVFFIGGTLLFEFISAILNKNKKQMLYIAISGMVILAIFALYYHWWMQPVAESMKAYWDNDARNTSIIRRIGSILIAEGYYFRLYFFVWFFVPFALLGIYSLCKSKNKIAYSLALSLFFAFLASSIGKWPLTSRLWLFLPVIVFIFAPIGTDIILNKMKNKKIINAIGFSFLAALTLYLSVMCLEYPKGMYIGLNEINPLISYVQKNIKYDEKLYVYPNAVSAFRYKNGYNATKIGNAANNNIIYGTDINEWSAGILGNDIQSIILENKGVYLIFAHHFFNIDNGLSILLKYGNLIEIMNVYDTYLIYFERNAD